MDHYGWGHPTCLDCATLEVTTRRRSHHALAVLRLFLNALPLIRGINERLRDEPPTEYATGQQESAQGTP